MCAITKFLKACVTNGAIPRHPTEEMLKEGQGTEVVINGGMTVDKNGDVAVGRNLEVDGTLTVGGEPITPGGGGTKLYKHNIVIETPDTRSGIIEFNVITNSNTPIELPARNNTLHITGAIPFIVEVPYERAGSNAMNRYFGYTVYVFNDHNDLRFGFGKNGYSSDMDGILLDLNLDMEEINVTWYQNSEIDINDLTDTVTEL